MPYYIKKDNFKLCKIARSNSNYPRAITRVLSVVRIKVSRSIATLISRAPSSPRSGINLVLDLPNIGTFDTSTRAVDDCVGTGIDIVSIHRPLNLLILQFQMKILFRLR